MAKEVTFIELCKLPSGTLFMGGDALLKKGRTIGTEIFGTLDCFAAEITPNRLSLEIRPAYFLLRDGAPIDDMAQAKPFLVLSEEEVVLLSNLVADSLPSVEGGVDIADEG